MRRMTMFWGCTIPTRFPFIEKATRLALGELGLDPVDVDGFTCCPEATLVRAADEETFYLAAARNLALAESKRLPVLTPCNGCYSTFKSVLADLKVDWRLEGHVNERLAEAGKTLAGDVDVWHLVEWLSEDLGPAALSKRVSKPLWGMKVAVHYGCHLLRPSPAVRWDSPTAPTKFEALIGSLGATVVDYETKMDCCGNALDRVGERQMALDLMEHKLSDVRTHEVDALVVSCPSCFLQFDLNQAATLRQAASLRQSGAGRSADSAVQTGVPVFYITELIALAMGHDPAELGLDMHRVSTAAFLEKWAFKLEQRAALAERFDLASLQICAGCKACDADCPVAQVETDFVPSAVINSVLAGDVDSVLAGPDPWRCTDCMTCFERCHSRIGMAEVFEQLKRMAAETGQVPAAARSGYQAFLADGVLGAGRASTRQKLGLPDLPETGIEELKRVLAGAEDRK